MSSLKETIEKVVNRESLVEELPFTPIRDIEAILKSMGYDDLEMDGDETNGWQIDFWYTFTGKDKPTLMLEGSLHYGELKISIKE